MMRCPSVEGGRATNVSQEDGFIFLTADLNEEDSELTHYLTYINNISHIFTVNQSSRDNIDTKQKPLRLTTY